MDFKKGDIVVCLVDGGFNRYGEIVFKLTSNPKLEYYIDNFGIKSTDLRWLASGKHIGTKYKGQYVNQFHLNNCVKYNEFKLYRKIKKIKL
jgi:hypothetical protein